MAVDPKTMDPSELDTAYRKHRQGLYTLALSITRCRAHAEDAVHDAFSRLAKIPRIDGDLVAYLYACVRNAAYDVQRRSARSQRLSESIFNGYVAPRSSMFVHIPDNCVLTAERDQVIRRALDQLPDEYREAVVLKIYADLTFRQIGEILDQPLKTVATRYRRALERLNDCLKGKL